MCLFCSHRDIFVINQEEQKNIKVGCEIGVGDFGPSNGKFLPVSQKISINMFGFLKRLFFFFFLNRGQCQHVAFSWCCDFPSVAFLSPKRLGPPQLEGVPQLSSGPIYQCHKSSN